MSEMPSSSYTLLDIPTAEPNPRPRASRCRRARTRLPAGARHPGDVRRPSPLPIGTLRPAAVPSLEGRSGQSACGLSRLDRQGARTAGHVPVWPGHRPGCATACRRMRSSATAPATMPAGCIVITASTALPRSSRRPRARWDMACRRRSLPSGNIRIAIVVAFAGDGCFLMNGQEFATAVQYDAPLVVIVDRQRAIRHHPHASGARLSRPRRRHPAQEP